MKLKDGLLLGRNVMTNLDSILKSRDITLPTKVCLVKVIVFPLDCREIQSVHPKENQSWTFIGRTDAEAETPILWTADVKNWLEETLMLGKIEGERKRGWQRMRWLDGIFDSMDTGLGGFWEWWKGRPGVLRFMGLWRVGHNWVTEVTDWVPLV